MDFGTVVVLIVFIVCWTVLSLAWMALRRTGKSDYTYTQENKKDEVL